MIKLKRKTLNNLNYWWNSSLRKNPCILFGARQTGKSTLARDFALSTKRKIIDINFWKDNEDKFKKIFTLNSSAKEVIKALEISLNQKINDKESILILDEIQECPNAYSLCKSFKEDTDLPIIATGSYLKLFLNHQLAEDKKFFIPVGCTHEINVTPLTFSEYLQNRNEFLYEKYIDCKLNSKVEQFIHLELLKIYQEYLFVGGLPEISANFINTAENDLLLSIKTTRILQNNILNGYKTDFLTFTNKKIIKNNISDKLSYTFEKIAFELYKSYELKTPVKKFTFKSLGRNETFKRTAHVFEYLISCGLITSVYFIEDIKNWHSTVKRNSFKCYYFDIGILNAQLGIDYKKIMDDNLNAYKGYVAENFVINHLSSISDKTYTWNNKNYEIEFLAESKTNELIPIEVKSSKKSVYSKSLNYYSNKFTPNTAIKIAPRNFGKKDNVLSMPIYLTEKLEEILA